MERLGAGCPYVDATSIVDATVRTVDEFTADCEQSDDLTLLVLMRKGTDLAADGAAVLEVDADMASLDVVRGAILAIGADEALRLKMCLATEEAFVNIVSYAGASRIWFAVEKDEAGRLCVTIADDGRPFDLTTAEVPEREFEELVDGGMGISLVRDLSSDVSYRRSDDGRNVLVFWVADS